MRMHTRNLLLLGALAGGMSSSCWGQYAASQHELDLAVTYSAEHSNLTTGSPFWRQGGSAELAATLLDGFGIGVSVNGSQASNIRGTGIDLSTLTFAAGPQYTWHTSQQKFAVFGEGLVGGSHAWNSLFPQSNGATESETSLAVQVGGGVDLKLKGRLAVRPVQADWIRTQFSNGTTVVQNSLRLTAGLVLHLSQ